MSTVQTPREELVREIGRLQGLLVEATEVAARLVTQGSVLRNELKRTRDERDRAEARVKELTGKPYPVFGQD